VTGLVGAALAVAAESAAADTYCVAPESSCPAANTYPSLNGALSKAASNPGKDTVRLGAATYSDGPFTANSGNPVDIVGHGTGQTILTMASQTNATVLTLNDIASTLTGVGIVVPSTSGNFGLAISGAATNIAITGPSATNPTGVVVSGNSASFSQSSISLPSTSSNQSTGVSGNGGTVADSTIAAFTGITSFSASGPTVERTKIFATTGFSVAGTIEDSVIAVKPVGATAPTGLRVSGNGVIPFASLTARHDTIIGDGSAGSVGGLVFSAGGISGTTADLTVNDSILRGFTTDLSRVGTPGAACPPTCAGTANLSYDYDDYGGVVSDNGGPGSNTDGGHNRIGVDPHFVASGATPPDYHLRYDSPLIDAGRPSVESGEASTDADGNPRTVDGNGDGTGATDIGAYEYQRRPPVPTGSASPPSGETGSTFTFTGSATDPDPGDTVTLTWSFDDGATGAGSPVNHAFASPGTHTATLTATDSAGASASVPVTVTVTAPAGPPGGGGGPGPGGGGAPVLSTLKLKPDAFRAARRGPSIAAARTGTTISYQDSAAAVTTFRVERAMPGVRRGHRCVKPSHKRTQGKKRCTRFVFVRGRFTHTDRAGINSFRFTGRLGGVKLKPGSYRLDATPQSGTQVGLVTRRGFRIIR
jgi:hypothetical protein